MSNQNDTAWREMTTEQKNKVGRLQEGRPEDTVSLFMNPFDLPAGWVSCVFLRDGRARFVCGIAPDGTAHS